MLEPDRHLQMKLMLTKEALYLGTNVLFGSSTNKTDAVTLWIDRSGQGNQKPGRMHLRLRLTADGKLTVGTGDGKGYSGPAPKGITSETIGALRFDFQEDLKPVNAPWWASEVRIPIEALAPLQAWRATTFRCSLRGHGTGEGLTRPTEGLENSRKLAR